MNEKCFEISDDEKELIKNKIKNALQERPEVMFAYLHGSFLKDDRFRDIDVAVFLKESPALPLRHELRLADELWRYLDKPAFELDVKVLNSAPVYFQYEVIRSGEAIYSRDEAERIEYEATLASDYLDYKPTLDFFDRELLARIG
jgi:predicted nucleotidyltransferase